MKCQCGCGAELPLNAPPHQKFVTKACKRRAYKAERRKRGGAEYITSADAPCKPISYYDTHKPAPVILTDDEQGAINLRIIRDMHIRRGDTPDPGRHLARWEIEALMESGAITPIEAIRDRGEECYYYREGQ